MPALVGQPAVGPLQPAGVDLRIVDPESALGPDGSQETDRLRGLEPGCLQRHEQCLDRLVRDEQGVAGMVDAVSMMYPWFAQSGSSP